uniref:KH domain-containing protein At4g18375-like protein n=1 Tax=Albuca bracteata TaxID=82047 RepID=A0A0A7LYW1_ALBBR|nr:KH domain-containing protein At4g18375-like protein [Albuca bracteata]
MGETGKRSRYDRDGNNDGKNQKKRVTNKENSDEGDLVVYRILCPNDVIGSVIGKSGKVINSLRQESHSRIKIVDPFPGAVKRVITIYCHVRDRDGTEVDEDDEEPICPAQYALLKVHSTIVNAIANTDDSDQRQKEEAHLLVPASQAAAVIGKSGATIKRLRSKTGANIKVNPKDPNDVTHSCAMSFDNFLQITGDAEAVKKALYAVSAIMYRFSPREEISLDTSVPELPSIIIPSDLPIYHAGSFFPGADAVIPPSRTVPAAVNAAPQGTDLHGFVDPASAWQTALPVVPGFSGQSRSEELIVRVLCPSDKIGRVIGKGGSTVKSIRQTSGARVEVDDKKHDIEECIITVTSTESTEDFKSAAVEAVLLLQSKINDEDEETVSIRLLVPSKVIGCLIGKSGSIINEMRKKTKADIRISKGEKPKHASANDELVEVSGEVGNVRDALLQIILRLREDALRDRDGSRNNPPVDSVYSNSMSVAPVLPTAPQVAPLSYDRADADRGGLGTFAGGTLYGYGSLQGGDSGYGSLSSYSSKGYGGLPLYNEVVIPASALSKVMGKGGANIDNIRKISGANVEIVDSKSSRSERVALISGAPEQKRAAEDMIRLFIMST